MYAAPTSFGRWVVRCWHLAAMSSRGRPPDAPTKRGRRGDGESRRPATQRRLALLPLEEADGE